MPDMSGDKVAATIRQSNSAIPIIMVTGFGEIMKDKGELPEGVDIILGKPITEKELQVAMATAMAIRSSQ